MDTDTDTDPEKGATDTPGGGGTIVSCWMKVAAGDVPTVEIRVAAEARVDRRHTNWPADLGGREAAGLTTHSHGHMLQRYVKQTTPTETPQEYKCLPMLYVVRESCRGRGTGRRL